MRLLSCSFVGLLLACGSPSAETPAAPTAPPPEAAPVVPPVVEPPPPPPAPARLEVPAPTDLAAAIGARLPTIELVPDACPDDGIVTSERVCLFDEASGRPRAMRRLATSSMNPAVSGARIGDDVVLAVVDRERAHTRYSGRLWRWELAEDRYIGLANLRHEEPPEAVATPFGVLFWPSMDVDLDEGSYVVTADEVLRPAGDVPEWPRVVGDDVLVCRDTAPEVGCDRLVLDGSHLRTERVVALATVDPLFVDTLPDHQPLIVVVEAAGERSLSVRVVEPPWTDVRTFTVPCRPHPRVEWRSGLRFRDGAGLHAIDLATGAVSDVEDTPYTYVPRPRLWPRGIVEIVPMPARVVVRGEYGVVYELGAEGLRGLGTDPPTWRRGPCACEGDALRCGGAPIVGACSEVAELDSVRDGSGEASQPSTLYDHEGHYRVDRLEPDYVRITRLSDGARLWVRIFEDGALAQADDGALQLAGDVPLVPLTVRWGRSLLSAPLSALEPYRAALERPTLVADFFGGRPLPAADTTLPVE